MRWSPSARPWRNSRGFTDCEPRNLQGDAGVRVLASHRCLMSEPMTEPVAQTVQLVELHRHDEQAVRAELAAGLLRPQAQLSPKFLYDRLGSRLFDAITALAEYYPTRTEAAILAEQAPAIAKALGPVTALVDLGAGDCAKAAALFPVLGPSQYVAVDISVEHLRQALAALKREHPAIQMLGVGTDFSQGLVLPETLVGAPRTLFYPGSSIGNFTPEQAVALLRSMHQCSVGGRLLIGADLQKSESVLCEAYDDALGVTAAFNRNLLRHVNARLGSDFDVRDWVHQASVDAARQCVQMHLVAARAVRVRWRQGLREFAQGETIHTEDSHKYTVEGFEALLAQAGWRVRAVWTDPKQWFAVFAAAAD